MAKLKTSPNQISVSAFLNGVEPAEKRKDAKAINQLMKKITGEKPKMWGPSIVGYGSYRLKYESGREMDWMLVGFAPRKANLVIYIMSGFENYEKLLTKVGKHKTGKSCFYIKKLSDINLSVLEEIIETSISELKKNQ